jgi:MHS family alpha-ketoglutarate permease-like MFS transporter
MFGGTAEYVALWLRSVGVETYFFFYVAGLAGIAFIASLLMPDLFRHGFLDGDGSVEENTGFKA